VKAMEHGLLTGRIKLEHCAITVDAAECRRPEEIAILVHHQACPGKLSVHPSRKGIEHGLVACGVQFEYGSGVVITAHLGGAIKIASGVADESCEGNAPVLSGPGEGMHHG